MKTKITKIFLLLCLIFAFTLSACAEREGDPLPTPVESVSLDTVIAEGYLVPAQSSWLNFAAQGRVEEILVVEGEQVAKDQVLIRLAGHEQAVASLSAAEFELARAQQDLDAFMRTTDLGTANAWQVYLDAQLLRAEAERRWENLDLDTLEDEIEDAQVEVLDRKEDLDDAQEEWDKYKDVDEDNVSRQNAEDDLEAAQEDYNEAQRNLEEARREIDTVRAAFDAALAAEAEARREYQMWLDEGVDHDQQALLELRVSAAEGGLAASQYALENYELTAPFAGTVTDINLEIGQFIGPEAMAVQIADLSEFKIETSDLTELEVIKISEGQVVEIVPDALPNIRITGIVDQIGQSFRTQAGDIIYKVTIKLDEIDPNLRWGMTVEITFIPE